jgi:hypothetical protein
MTDLSPAAQAVFNAAWTCPIALGDHPATRRRQLAAALRAAADQVEQKLRGFSREACQEIRFIAAELDDINHTSEGD